MHAPPLAAQPRSTTIFVRPPRAQFVKEIEGPSVREFVPRYIAQFAFALIILLSVTSRVAAQSPDSLLKKACKAMGGERALRGITTRAASGAIRRASDGAQGGFQMTENTCSVFINQAFCVSLSRSKTTHVARPCFI